MYLSYISVQFYFTYYCANFVIGFCSCWVSMFAFYYRIIFFLENLIRLLKYIFSVNFIGHIDKI
jgi:hypothetical protein